MLQEPVTVNDPALRRTRDDQNLVPSPHELSYLRHDKGLIGTVREIGRDVDNLHEFTMFLDSTVSISAALQAATEI
jgi:hypothetical protein